MKALIISVPKTTTKFTTKNEPHGTERITSGYDYYSMVKTVKKITSALARVIFFDVFTSNNYSLQPSYITKALIGSGRVNSGHTGPETKMYAW